MSNVEQYLGITETPADVITDILTAGDVAYRQIGERFGYDPAVVHTIDVCSFVTHALIYELIHAQAKPYAADVVHTEFETISHVIVSVWPASGRRILADPTYQQFMHEREDEHSVPEVALPRMLLGTPAEAVKQAVSYGFSERQATETWLV